MHDVSFLAALALDGSVETSAAHRERYTSDAGVEEFGHLNVTDDGPDAVVYAESTADVSTMLAACTEHGVPVTPYAAGTGLEAGAVPVEGGVSLDLTGLDRILDVRPESLQVDAEAGVLGGDLNERLEREALFLPPLPSSAEISTLGGMVATDAAGMGTVKYGEVADWLLEAEAVLADGTVVEVGSKARKTSAGYNLKDLLVGSEGTLAVVTRVTFRLAGLPEQRRGGRATFGSLDDAAAAVADAVGSGVDLAKVELLDTETVRMANTYSDIGLPERPTLFVEFHADHGIETEVAFCETVFNAHGLETFDIAEDEGAMAELWKARKDLTYALELFDPDRTQLQPGDITVPIGRYAEMVREAKALGEEYGLAVPCFGHAGDGNVHFSIIADPEDPDEVSRANDCYDAIIERALDLDGTVTGEHGIGAGKRGHLESEHGKAGVDLMRRVKRAFDPDGILNPGKVLPDPVETDSE
ncbi:FAD-binding oxidoreductase [Halolamina sp.]|jgi:D-lactate dehydrogenase (cytochrome)|uniref:FAD-binding oxidoreductase n=1 Tax=Halolamina sp. TaxID=1940283 RepID=UPI000223C0D3|nr:D-lactate dehydrogenase (cytochrome) [halophilic archaeon DL31]